MTTSVRCTVAGMAEQRGPTRRLRLRTGLRWLAVPWSEWALAGALVVAFAAPVLLIASVDVWQAAAADDLTQRSVADVSLARNGVDVTVESEFSPAAVAGADRELTAALGQIPQLGDVDRSDYTFTGLLAIGPPPIRQVGPAGRLASRAGAIDAVEVVAELDDTSDGVWISTWFAERLGVELGDTIAFEAGAISDEAWNDLVQGGGADSAFKVVGLYEPLWSDDPTFELNDYWAEAPPELLPVYIEAFNQPSFELVLTDEATLLDSALTGVVRWRAPLTSIPTSYDDLRELRDEIRALEGALVTPGPLAESMKSLATPAQRRPVLTTDIFETTADVEEAVARLVAPLRSARALGAVVGLMAVFALGVFFVERRRSEFRLLASEGEQWPKMAARVAGQLTLPAIAGGAVGATIAVVGLRWFGPSVTYDIASLPWRPMVIAMAVSLAVAAVTAGVLGSHTLRIRSSETKRAVLRIAVVVLLAATLVAWSQVERTTASGATSLDLVVVVLPVLVIALAVLALVTVLGWAARLAGGMSDRLPVEAFIAARRVAVGSVAVRMVIASLGLGIGLLVFSLAITGTLDRAVDVRLATSVGGESSATLLDELPPTRSRPAPTTVLRESDTRLLPGSVAARIVAIDPATYADAVTWSDQFGAEVDEVLEALSSSTEESIPVIAIEGEPVPEVGSFGLSRSYPYRVVATVRGFPTAGNRSVSLLASADAINEYAARSGDEGAPAVTESFRRTVVSQAGADALTDWLDQSNVGYRDVVSQAELRQSPTIVATRTAFGYLGMIGVTASAAAMVSLALFLSARRRSSALTGVITRSMGMSPARSAAISAIELGAILVAAVGAALLAAPAVVSRLAPRFDPAPGRPPAIAVVVDWAPLLVVAVVGVVIVSALVWLSEWIDGRRPAGAVVRDGR